MRTSGLILVLLLLLAGCRLGGGEEEAPPGIPDTPRPPTATPTPTPSPADWLDAATERWKETESFHFTLTLEERVIALDATGVLGFSEAEGNVIAPDRMQALALINTPLGSAQVDFIAVGEDQYLTNPLSGQWEPLDESLRSDITLIFDETQGVVAVMGQMQGLERLPDERVAGPLAVHLRGTIPAETLAFLASDLAGAGTLTVDLWIETQSAQILKIVITEPVGAEGTTPVWTFLLSNFGGVAPIEPPL